MTLSGKEDRRIEKTEASIRNAFIDLITEKEISQITIKELAEKANINRKTFYTHYTCIDELIDKIGNEIVDKLLLVLEKYDFFDSKFDAYALFMSLNDVINENFDLYKQLLRYDSNNFFVTKVKKILKDSIIERYQYKFKLDKDTFSLYTEYVASGIISMYIEWFNRNSLLSLEDLARIAGNITLNGMKHLIAN